MKELLVLTLFLAVGISLLGLGVFYMKKEKEDRESVKIYRTAAIIGAVLTIGSVAVYFIF